MNKFTKRSRSALKKLSFYQIYYKFILKFFALFTKYFHLNIMKIILAPETKIAKYANSLDLDEVAHKEPTYLDLHSLPSYL